MNVKCKKCGYMTNTATCNLSDDSTYADGCYIRWTKFYPIDNSKIILGCDYHAITGKEKEYIDRLIAMWNIANEEDEIQEDDLGY